MKNTKHQHNSEKDKQQGNPLTTKKKQRHTQCVYDHSSVFISVMARLFDVCVRWAPAKYTRKTNNCHILSGTCARRNRNQLNVQNELLLLQTSTRIECKCDATSASMASIPSARPRAVCFIWCVLTVNLGTVAYPGPVCALLLFVSKLISYSLRVHEPEMCACNTHVRTRTHRRWRRRWRRRR